MGKAITNNGINIIDSAGGTVVDGRGLVSATNFVYSKSDLGNGTSTANSANDEYGTVPGGTITLARVRETTYLIGVTVAYFQEYMPSREGVVLRFCLNGTANKIGPAFGDNGHTHSGAAPGTANGTSLSTDVQTQSISFIYTAPTGTSDLTLHYAVDDRTSGTARVLGSSNNGTSQIFAIRLGI